MSRANDRPGPSFFARNAHAAWHSATLTTWGSFATRSLTFILVVPLVLTRFAPEDVALWYVFASMIALQMQADLGFSPTFSRLIAFALAGRRVHELDLQSCRAEQPEDHPENWETIALICASMRVVYLRLTVIAIVVFGVVGTLVVRRPASLSSDVSDAWFAWLLILLGSVAVLYGNQFSAYLQGLNQVALVRRWEAITNVCALLTSFIVLLAGGGILELVIASQVWAAVNVLRNRALARFVRQGRYRTFALDQADKQVMAAAWPSAWRSSLGTFAGQVPLQFAGLVYAQFGAAARVAGFLLGLHLLTAIRTFANAPFYSKLPVLARLRAAAKYQELLAISARGMRSSYWVYTISVALMGLFAAPLMQAMGSSVEFVPPLLWALLAFGAMVERYGALHLQLYSTTNDIRWHIANGLTAVSYGLIVVITFRQLDWYAFAVAYIAAYSLVYAPYSALHSYRSLPMKALQFEMRVLLMPATALIAFVVFTIIR